MREQLLRGRQQVPRPERLHDCSRRDIEQCIRQQRQQLAIFLAQLPLKVLWRLQDKEVARLDLGSNTKMPMMGSPSYSVAFCFIISLVYRP